MEIQLRQQAPYFERKFELPLASFSRTLAYLRHQLVAIPEHARGKNRTVYFDDDRWTLLLQGIDGLSEKCKVRWRENVERDTPTRSMLELKTRIGESVIKQKAIFSEPYALKLNQSLLQVIQNFDPKLREPFCRNVNPARLYPRLVLEYERYRFSCPQYNIRVNLDCGIRSLFVAPVRGLVLKREQLIPRIVLELKSPERCDAPALLSGLELKPASESKYLSVLQSFRELAGTSLVPTQ